MEPDRLLVMPSKPHTRLLRGRGRCERSRAVVPPLTHVRQPRAVQMRLEALRWWADTRRRGVRCADATARTSWLGRADACGGGARSGCCEVEGVTSRQTRRAAPVHAFGNVGDWWQRRLALRAEGVS
jgi:hypothetical protein